MKVNHQWVLEFQCEIFSPRLSSRFKAAFEAVIDLHEVLKSKFLVELSTDHDFMFPDLSQNEEIKEWDLRWEEVSWLASERPDFSSFNTPNKIFWVKASDLRSYIVWNMEGELLDRQSMGILIREVLRSYSQLGDKGYVESNHVSSDSKSTEAVQRRDKKPDQEFWKNYIAGITGPTLLSSNKPDSKSSSSVETQSCFFSQVLSQGLRNFAHQNQRILSTVFYLAWALLLKKVTQKDDLVFGILTSSRSNGFGNDWVGNLNRILPLRVRTKAGVNLQEILQALPFNVNSLISHSCLSVDEIFTLGELQEGEFRGRVLFDTLLIYEDLSLEKSIEKMEEGLQVSWIKNFNQDYEFDCPLIVKIKEAEEFDVQFIYSTENFSESEIRRLIQEFEVICQEMIEPASKKETHLKEATIPSQLTSQQMGQQIRKNKDLQELIDLYQNNWQEGEVSQVVKDLFEEQVAQIPDQVAVFSEHKNFTYRELNEQADLICAYLKQQGVCPESKVAILIEDGLEFISALLGILKSGSIYIPVDSISEIETQADVFLCSPSQMDFPKTDGVRFIYWPNESASLESRQSSPIHLPTAPLEQGSEGQINSI